MKQAVPRSLACAVFTFASLAIAAPVFAQAVTTAATPVAAHATKPAHAAKPSRWTPRRYYYSRWRPYSRWGWHSAWHKPAVAAKPAAKLAVKPAATKAAGAVSAKPASANAAHSVKPAAWAKSAAKATAKPAAKPSTAKPIVKPTVTKAVPMPSTAVGKTASLAPVGMTRDANNGAQIVTADSPIAGGDRIDIAGQAGKMAGALVFVALVIVGIVFLLRKYNLVPATEAGASLAAAPPIKAPNSSKGLAAAFLPVFGNLAASKGQPPKTASASQDLSDAMIGNGGLQIVGAQPLPGSGTIIYLVQIEDHMVLLGASYAGGVRQLAEWEKDGETETEEEKVKFDSFLRQQGVPPDPVREEEEHTFATIRARLNSTAERLAGLRQGFGT